jgi:hypothetical protein
MASRPKSNAPDLSEFFRLSRPRRKPCAVAAALEQLSADEREKLEAANAHDQGIITNAAIRDWLKARSIIVNDAQVRVHRTGTCACSDA